MTKEELEELTAWRRRVRQAHRIARRLVAGQRVWIYEHEGKPYVVPLGRADLHHHHPRANLPVIRYRIIGQPALGDTN